ncbi:MAG: hypothetical protein Q4F06_05920 [Eubacteriales bacterium]|nr:hypothetical protein [Eubacteriales bacterium]
MKKSRLWIIVWSILLCVVATGICFLPLAADVMMRVELNICSLAFSLLVLVIYLTGNVYWYTGISYEDAMAAGIERSRLYALKHLIRFGGFALAFLLYSVVAAILHINYWIDFIIFTVGIIVIAFSTMKIKL